MNNSSMTLSEIVTIYFKKEVIDAAEKFVNDSDVIKCAESIKDMFKDASKLKDLLLNVPQKEEYKKYFQPR